MKSEQPIERGAMVDPKSLLQRRCWIFDMDGTLTHPVHDFEAIRQELGLSRGRPILESMAAMSTAEAAPLRRRLVEIERELVLRARPQEDAVELVNELRTRRGPSRLLGVVTRNTRELAGLTLERVGLDAAFDPSHRIGRHEAVPKPSPAGIEMLLADWDAQPSEAVMVGDYLFDLQAGRAAGVATVLIDRDGHGRWRSDADVVVADLRELFR